jgi:DNA-binding transcriptional regulator YhcF (GntR family)
MSKYRVKVVVDNPFTKRQQIFNAFVKDIELGKLKVGERLPSINEFAEINNVGRDTIERAYKMLKEKGFIASFPSRGYFVMKKKKCKHIRVLLVFNKLSSFKKIVYYSFLEELGARATVDLQIHHNSSKIFKEILNANLGKYDYYVAMPHFFDDAHITECVNVCKTIPSHELIILDKTMPQLGAYCKSVCQDFKWDIYEALGSLDEAIKKYERISLVFPKDIHHPREIIEGIHLFCNEQALQFTISDIEALRVIGKGTLYIVIEEDDLGKLIKQIRNTGFMIGKEIGVISFNETVLKELLDITVITTDFDQMGRSAAQLLLQKEIAQLKNPFKVLQRGSV